MPANSFTPSDLSPCDSGNEMGREREKDQFSIRTNHKDNQKNNKNVIQYNANFKIPSNTQNRDKNNNNQNNNNPNGEW